MSTKVIRAGTTLRRLRDPRQPVEPRVRHVHLADVRLDGAERKVRRLRRRGPRQRVEQRRLADVRQPDDPDLQSHAAPPCRRAPYGAPARRGQAACSCQPPGPRSSAISADAAPARSAAAPQARFFSAAITSAEQQHPADVAGPDHEHDQHQRPAAADAEGPVREPEPPGLAPSAAPRASAAVTSAERAAAAVEAAPLQRGELERARPAPAPPPPSAQPLKVEPGRAAAPPRSPPRRRVRDDPEPGPGREVAQRHRAPCSRARRRAAPSIRPKSQSTGSVVGSIIAASISAQPAT